MKGKLDDSLCYLIGAMEDAPDNGVTWRDLLIRQCKERGLGIKYLDPTNKVPSLAEISTEDQDKIVELKRNHDWDRLTQMMKVIIRNDHRCVDLSDFVIFYSDSRTHTCGSYFELQSALTQKKPYFIISPEGKGGVPAWIFGLCNHEYFFNSVEEVVNKMVELDSGLYPMSDRWVLFRKDINEL